MNDFEYASEQLAKMRKRVFINDYFPGSHEYRVFYFDVNERECWRDVFATDIVEAVRIFLESIPDSDIDQIIPKQQ